MNEMYQPGKALFSISVASDLTGVSPQALRGYEDKGLLTPYRTEGRTRRYSSRDIDLIKEIATLAGEGLNLAAIAHVLRLQAETTRLRDQLQRARKKLDDADS